VAGDVPGTPPQMVLGAVAILAPVPPFLGPPGGDVRERPQREPDGSPQRGAAVGLRGGLSAQLLDRIRQLLGSRHVQPQRPDEPAQEALVPNPVDVATQRLLELGGVLGERPADDAPLQPSSGSGRGVLR
jgi:hypothetical protein